MGTQDDASGSESDGSRRNRLIALVESTTAQDHSTFGRAQLVGICAASISEVGVSGAGITVMGSTDGGLAGQRDQLWATNPLARRLEDLQLTAGEGPCLDAYDAGAPSLAGDLVAEQTHWVGFAPEAIAAGAAAAFSLPLQIGAIRLGTLDLHRTTRGPLGRAELANALVLATLAAEILFELAGDPHSDPGVPPGSDAGGDPGAAGLLSESPGWLPDVHAEVHQASGMVAARENIGVGEALLRMRGYAFARSEPIQQVARRIVNRDLVLDDHHPSRDVGPEGPGTETER